MKSLGPSPKALQAMRAAERMRIFTGWSGFYLRKAIRQCKLAEVPQNVILGNGSNEVIEFLVTDIPEPW